MKYKDGNLVSPETMISRIASSFQVDRTFAENVLKELGIVPTKTFNFSANEPYTPSSDYLSQLLGGW